MIQTKDFSFATPLIDSYNGNQVAIAILTGKCTQNHTGDNGEFDIDYCTIDYVRVVVELGWNRQDNTFAYIVDKAIGGHFADMVDKAIEKHCAMLFAPIEERPTFRTSYKGAQDTFKVGVGYHEDNSPEARNESIHNNY